jgi:hypothetical protein
MTINSRGQVLPKSKRPPWTWWRRNRRPRVIRIAGPIIPRIVQLWQRHRVALIVSISLTLPTYLAAKKPNADSDQHEREENLAKPEEIEEAEIFQQEKDA